MTKLGYHRFEITNETRAVGKDFQCVKSLGKRLKECSMNGSNEEALTN